MEVRWDRVRSGELWWGWRVMGRDWVGRDWVGWDWVGFGGVL